MPAQQQAVNVGGNSLKSMRNLSLILFIAFIALLRSFGQQGTIDYDFLKTAFNQIETKIKHPKLSPFYLYYKASLPHFTSDDFTISVADLKNKIDSNTLREIFKNSNSSKDTEKEFDSTKLHNTIVFTDSLYNSFVGKRQLFYIANLPIYDKAKQYAVIGLAGGSGRLELNANYYLFKKTKLGWKLISEFFHQIT